MPIDKTILLVSIYCPSCGHNFTHEKKTVGKTVGFLGGAALGAKVGAGVGLVGGPLGAIAGTIPGASPRCSAEQQRAFMRRVRKLLGLSQVADDPVLHLIDIDLAPLDVHRGTS